MKFFFGMDDGPSESRLGLVDDIVLGVCCRLLDEDEVVDDGFFM